MASPTEADVITMFKNVVKIYEEARRFAESNASNWIDLEDALVQSLETDFGVEILEGIAGSRSRLDALLRDAGQPLGAVVRQWGKTAGFAETSVTAILGRLFRRMVDVTGDRVQSRMFTFGSPTAATGNVGNGVIVRLTKDADNFDIENQHPDSKIARCIADMQTGAPRHEEVFEIRGSAPGRDALELSGSGSVTNMSAMSARASLLANPSFSRYSGTLAVPTAITDWDTLSGDFTAYEISETYYFRDFQGDTIPRSLKVKGNDTIYQKLSARNISLQPDVPYLLTFAYNRNATTASAVTAGTLTAHLGAISSTIDLSTGSGWQRAYVPSTIGANCWPRNFNEDDLDIAFTSTGITAPEEFYIDDVLLVPGVPFDGAWYWILGGTTRFQLDDEFTWSDTCIDSVLQRWLWRIFGIYLPHATGSGVTITDP